MKYFKLLIIGILTVFFLIYLEYSDLESGEDHQPIFQRPPPVRQDFYKTGDPCLSFSTDELRAFPKCRQKMEWMETGWTTHKCYSERGVNGTTCSFRSYLAEVEQLCPPKGNSGAKFRVPISELIAKKQFDLAMLIKSMNDTPANYEFMFDRFSRMWSSWTNAYDENLRKRPDLLKSRLKLNIIVHMGFLTRESNFQFATKSNSGGPLGELVQWSDLIAALYVLGHNLFISSERKVLFSHISRFERSSPCESSHIDLIITDIVGLRRSFKKRRNFLAENRCKIRILDSFGTHAEFNYRPYFYDHRNALGKDNSWGNNELNLKQFWTFYPHSSDNGFLGFAIKLPDVEPLFDRRSHNAVLIYGKLQYMWEGFEDVITFLKSRYEVHATVPDAVSNSSLFDGIVNHRLLNATELTRLLRSVKIFIGLGFPLEGPAPLEAIAAGTPFVNPIFSPPESRLNTKFLSSKPTLRQFTSQVPYLETIGRPHVYSIPIKNLAILKHTVDEIMKSPNSPSPLVPKIFTCEGMLLRVSQLVSRYDFCGSVPSYPPSDMLQVETGNESCQMICGKRNLICEPTLFSSVNSYDVLKKANGCRSDDIIFTSSDDVLAPYDCVRQSKSILFSCSSSPGRRKVRRVCPCRSLLPEDAL